MLVAIMVNLRLAIRRLARSVIFNRRVERLIVKLFSIVYYGNSAQTWMNTRWLGVTTLKYPFDLWIYQELIFELRPNLIIESGTWDGGSALYFASLCDLVRNGRVVTIDISDLPGRPEHPRITYITGSSVEPTVVAQVREIADASATVLIILDSDHSKAHVLREIQQYAPLVTAGSYLIVEDTNINGNPVYGTFGPGPMEAVDEFMASDTRFEIDRDREKFLLTANPGGYLRRKVD